MVGLICRPLTASARSRQWAQSGGSDGIGRTLGKPLKLLKEVFVNLLEDERLLNHDAAAMFDHEGGQFGAVDEDQARVHAKSVVTGIRAEAGGRDEDPATGLSAMCSSRSATSRSLEDHP